MMFDPGFENESDLDEPGFGWRAAEKSGEVIFQSGLVGTAQWAFQFESFVQR